MSSFIKALRTMCVSKVRCTIVAWEQERILSPNSFSAKMPEQAWSSSVGHSANNAVLLIVMYVSSYSNPPAMFNRLANSNIKQKIAWTCFVERLWNHLKIARL